MSKSILLKLLTEPPSLFNFYNNIIQCHRIELQKEKEKIRQLSF